MKKFISFFLVISMIMCNLNTGVVEALSTYGDEVKSLVNTLTNNKEEKTVAVEDNKGLVKETEQVSVNNKVESTKVVDSKNKDKSLSTDNKSNVQKKITLIYNIEEDIFYYIDSNGEQQELSLMNEKITKIKNKINLNNLLKYNNFNKSMSDVQEVNLIITGTGSDITLWFDNNDYPDIPFNIEFNKMNGTDCHFIFENVKSMHIKDNNTISNSSSDEAALTYSFNCDDLNPL